MVQTRYTDDIPLFVVHRDISKGMNNRQADNILPENGVAYLLNGELGTQGERSIRKGNSLCKDLGDDFGTGAFGFEPEGGTNELLVTEDVNLQGCTNPTGGGSDTFNIHDAGFTADLQTTMIKAIESDEGDVVIISNGTDNVHRMLADHTVADLGNTNTSPPLTTVMTYYRDRLWALDGEKLMYSGAVPSDYSDTFDRASNYYSIPIGNARALVGTKEYGLIVMGTDSIYTLNPSVSPDPTADKPDILVEYGCAAGNTALQVADDILYLSFDGVRGLRRTINDKLQSGESKPLSWELKDELGEINWAYAHKACAVYYDNKYIVSLPTTGDTYNSRLWIYYPTMQAWAIIEGINIAAFAKVKIGNDERLIGIDSNDGAVYRMFYGTNDNGTAITYQEEGRAEDFGKPLQNKYGGEYKIKIIGSGATVTPYADIDNAGYVQLDGDPLTIDTGGLDFNFDFPFNFDRIRGEEQWHLDNLGPFKQIKFKLHCNTKDAELTILESLATTFMEEYQPED